jgi:hypothetical protein
MESAPLIPLAQLVDPEHTPGENHQDRQTDKRRENLEPRVQFLCRSPASSDVAGVAESVLNTEGDENEQNRNLERQACQPEIDAGGRRAVGLGGEGATDGLDYEAEGVEGDEELVVEGGLELGAGGGEAHDAVEPLLASTLVWERWGGEFDVKSNAPFVEGDVDGGAHEDRREGDADWTTIDG